MPDILDSIDWGTSVASTSVTVYFAEAGETFGGVTSDGWLPYEITRAMAALNQYALLSNLTFSQTFDSGTATFKLVIATMAEIGGLGAFKAPGEPDAGVGFFAWDGSGWNGTGGLEKGGDGFYTLLHEFGHGLGLAHPHDTGGTSVIMEGVTSIESYGDYQLNQGVFTVMSYNDGWELHPDGGSPSTDYGRSGGLGALDIALIQSKYGASTINTGDNSYYLWTTNGIGTSYETIVDSGGVDEIVNSSSLDSTISLISATIDYSPTGGGVISFVDGIHGGFTIAKDVVIENATGGSGSDILIGNSASNVLDGGLGTDTVSYRHAAAAVTVGLDTASPQDTIGAGTDTLLNFENLTGSAFADDLTGSSGVNILDGGAGADEMAGLGGHDTYLVDDSLDVVVETAVEGIDVVQTSLSAYQLGANVEYLIYAGTPTADFAGTGNELPNYLQGWNGDDTLDGGAGPDSMAGLAGDDTYKVDSDDDLLDESVNAGTDTVATILTLYQLGPNIERLIYEGPQTADFAGTGNELDNYLEGWDGDDTLDGAAGADEMAGLGGDDAYGVDNSLDEVVEAPSAGTDTVYTSLAAYTLGANVERLIYAGPQTADFAGTGNTLDNYLEGWDGDDTLDGAAGADEMAGLGGDDAYGVDNSLDEVVEAPSAGTDTVYTSLAVYTLGANVERLIYAGPQTADFAGTGNTLDNYLEGWDGDDTLDGGAGADEMAGLGGDDGYKVDDEDDQVTESADEGTDEVETTLQTYALTANVENLTYTGLSGSFTGTGNGLANVIAGGASSDLLDGGAGADTLTGGNGTDTYVVDSLSDQVVELAGGGADDRLWTALAAYTLPAQVEILVGQSQDGQELTGNALANEIVGQSGHDALDGAAGNDTLKGGAGNDELDGGLGDDSMDGDAGNDTYLIDSAADAIVETLTSGSIADVAKSTVSYVLGAGVRVETLMTTSLAGTSPVNLAGNEFANTVIGNAGANLLAGMAANDSLVGDAGDDELDGGAGDDAMNGGAGNDTYLIDSAADAIVETLTTGSTADVARSSVSYILGAGVRVESLMTTSLAGTAPVNLTGNEFANTITGNAGANILKGMAANDSLTGDAGNDELDGGAGDDTLNGGAGNDTYLIDSTADTIVETLTTGSTADVAKSAVSYILGAGVRVESLMTTSLAGTALINLTGNELANTVTGNAGANILKGMAGNDSLVGDAGNDSLDGGTGNDTLNGGAGNDTFILDSATDVIVETLTTGSTADVAKSSVSYILGAEVRVESLVTTSLAGTALINLTGNELANAITGNAGANILKGMAGNDSLVGDAGNDSLDGGTGNDTLNGGGGNDTFILDSATDVIVETLTTGSTADVAKSAVSYILAAGVRVEQLMTTSVTGTALIHLTGNEFGNIITGNAAANALKGMGGNDTLKGDAGNDTLDGGTGNDALDGGAGNDVFILDSATDIIVEALTTGSTADVAKASVTYALAAGVRIESLMTTSIAGTALINLTGNEFGNIITGNAGANILKGMAGNDTIKGDAGNDTLDGGAGNDTLDGGAGDDIFILDSATDIIVETATTGSTADVAKSSVSYVVAAGVRVETLTTTSSAGTAPIDLTGNELANAITGNAGVNILKGLGGSDTLKGAAGNDNIQGGTGSDKIYGGLGNDVLRGDASAGDHGVDRFYFDTAPNAASNRDQITDFNPADDFIHLARSVFTQAGPAGTLAVDAFHTIGVGAADAQDRIIYNSATGALFYDPDGTGAAAAIQFATVTAGLALANTDFIVF